MAVGGFVVQLLPNKKKGRILTADNWRLDAQVVQRGLRHCAQLQVDAMPWTAKPDRVVRDTVYLNPLGVHRVLLCHRNLNSAIERSSTSDF
jgi:hypothetical protein